MGDVRARAREARARSRRCCASVALTDAIRVVILLEALSLGFWAGLAAWYAGLRGRMLWGSILAGLVISGLVLLLQLILQPGKVAE